MNNLNSILQISQMGNFVKIGFLVVDFAFALFLVIVLRQVYTMNTVVNDSHDSSIVKTAAFLLLIIAVSLFLTALVIL